MGGKIFVDFTKINSHKFTILKLDEVGMPLPLAMEEISLHVVFWWGKIANFFIDASVLVVKWSERQLVGGVHPLHVNLEVHTTH